MNLYEIDQNMMDAFNEAVDPDTGEIIDEEALERFNKLAMSRDTKIENIALWIKDLKADSNAYKAEMDAFAARKKQADSKIKSLEKYLKNFLDGDKYKSERVSISYRKSEAVKVTNLEDIPIKYLKMADPTADNTAIKKAIKAGETVPGAEIETNQNMIIK